MRPPFPHHLAVLALALLPHAAQGQGLTERLAAKLAEPWVKNTAWITDYAQAKAEAKKRGRPIFGYFTRSYAP